MYPPFTEPLGEGKGGLPPALGRNKSKECTVSQAKSEAILDWERWRLSERSESQSTERLSEISRAEAATGDVEGQGATAQARASAASERPELLFLIFQDLPGVPCSCLSRRSEQARAGLQQEQACPGMSGLEICPKIISCLQNRIPGRPHPLQEGGFQRKG